MCLEAFAATEFNKISSGIQPRQSLKIQGGSNMTGTR